MTILKNKKYFKHSLKNLIIKAKKLSKPPSYIIVEKENKVT